ARRERQRDEGVERVVAATVEPAMRRERVIGHVTGVEAGALRGAGDLGDGRLRDELGRAIDALGRQGDGESHAPGYMAHRGRRCPATRVPPPWVASVRVRGAEGEDQPGAGRNRLHGAEARHVLVAVLPPAPGADVVQPEEPGAIGPDT